MSWQDWEEINEQDIIKSLHLEQLHNNLKWLSEQKIQNRCIGHYLSVCSAQNSAWYNSDCPGNKAAANSTRNLCNTYDGSRGVVFYGTDCRFRNVNYRTGQGHDCRNVKGSC